MVGSNPKCFALASLVCVSLVFPELGKKKTVIVNSLAAINVYKISLSIPMLDLNCAVV